MKKRTVFLLQFIAIAASAQEIASPKPGISIAGIPCLIQNTIWTCVTKTCDSVEIYAGDSLEFCTYQQISLNSDTAYYMKWEFNGSDLAVPLYDSFPSQTPVCYYPKWSTAGIYFVDIYYNGWYTAYPGSDCYFAGPSHWIVQVNVVPAVSIGEEENSAHGLKVFPDPSAGIFLFEMPAGMNAERVLVTDLTGKIILTEDAPDTNAIDLTLATEGLYILNIQTPAGIMQAKILKL